jgi:hypothetical protein
MIHVCNILYDQASEICNETGDKAGCYHLARQLENQDHIKEAIHFFQRAEAFGNAIRLCKVYSNLFYNLSFPHSSWPSG